MTTTTKPMLVNVMPYYLDMRKYGLRAEVALLAARYRMVMDMRNVRVSITDMLYVFGRATHEQCVSCTSMLREKYPNL